MLKEVRKKQLLRRMDLIYAVRVGMVDKDSYGIEMTKLKWQFKALMEED